MPVLDSNFLIRLDVEDKDAVRALDQVAKDVLIVPAQAALEFLAGVDDPERAMQVLEGAFVVEMPIKAVTVEAAILARLGRERSFRVQSGDAWIAAHAMVRGDFVISSNKRHFKRLDVPCWDFGKEPAPPQ